MKHAKWRIVKNEPGQPLVIRDVGHEHGCLTITNDAENVVARLRTYLPPGRRLLYYDSYGELTQLIVREGRFHGFGAVDEEDQRNAE